MDLELLAATSWFWIFSAGFLASILGSIALLFCPTLWFLPVIYAVWIVYDRGTSERGGRPIQWIRSWTWFRLMKYYFNHNLMANHNTEIDPSKNYIFACFPHGVFPIGPFASFVNDYQTFFPKHTTFLTALGVQFYMPVIRELFLATGHVSVSGPSIKHVLKKPGGNIVSILVGGGDEAEYSAPGKYKIILEKRKGFVKLALQYGAPLVPVFSFGEVDVFKQFDFPGFRLIKSLVKSVLGVVLVLPLGRYLVCPNKASIVTVVGAPLEVKKTENPTNEEIEELHKQFVDSIRNLFEEYKHKYLKNPEKAALEIV